MARDKLRISGMIFHAYHGLEKHEMENGQRFEVDIEMIYDAAVAAASDKIRDTIDVREIYEQVKQVVMKSRFYLIETISQRIAEAILNDVRVEEVNVRVRKPFAPLGGLANGTEVEIVRRRPC
jgi:dihydroneopterin aldolase